MKNLIKELTKENESRIKKTIENFHNELKESNELTRIEKYTLNRKTPYKRSRANQVEKRITEIYNKELQNKLNQIESVKNSFDKLPNDLVLTINFYKSSTWGYCPKGSDNYGHSTDSITGCGYCKESTATAQLLNQNETILKKLYEAKNKNVNKENRGLLGYGSGYGIIPKFEGGVGVRSHVRILEALGYKVTLSGNDSTTVLIVSEK
jgi:hypothetical protein